MNDHHPSDGVYNFGHPKLALKVKKLCIPGHSRYETNAVW